MEKSKYVTGKVSQHDLYRTIAERADVPFRAVQVIMDLFQEEVQKNLSEGKEIRIMNLFTIRIVTRTARTFYSPLSGTFFRGDRPGLKVRISEKLRKNVVKNLS